MSKTMENLIEQYVEAVKKIYGSHIRQIILYGSYAREDFRPDSDVDIMILLDMSDLELKAYAQQLSYMKQRKPEIGTRRDLVLYRLETAKNDLKSARALFAMEDYRGANNRAY